VDDCLIFCQDKAKNHERIAELKQNFTLVDQGDMTAYLGINVTQTTCNNKHQFNLSLPHLMQCSIVSLSASHVHNTLAEPGSTLPKDNQNWSH
jgi:hypothetical protein